MSMMDLHQVPHAVIILGEQGSGKSMLAVKLLNKIVHRNSEDEKQALMVGPSWCTIKPLGSSYTKRSKRSSRMVRLSM